MAANRADFTLTFRRLCDVVDGSESEEGTRLLFDEPTSYDKWATAWRQRMEVEAAPASTRAAAMRIASPAFIPRNHLVEAMLNAAVERQDFQPFEELLDVVSRPYENRQGLEKYATPARPEERVSQTFCGT